MSVTYVVSDEHTEDEIADLIDSNRYALALSESERDDIEAAESGEKPDIIFFSTATEAVGHMISGYAELNDDEAYDERAVFSEGIAVLLRKRDFAVAMNSDDEFVRMAEDSDDLVTAYNTEVVTLDGPWPEDLPRLTVSRASYSDEADVPTGNVTVIDPHTEVTFLRGMAATKFFDLRENTEAVVDDGEAVSA